MRQGLATMSLTQPAVVVAPAAGAGAWTLRPALLDDVVERLAGDVVAEHHEHGRRADAPAVDRDRRRHRLDLEAAEVAGDRLGDRLDLRRTPSM